MTDKMIFQLCAVMIGLLALCASFIAVDKYHERQVRVKLAEMGYDPYTYEIKEKNL